MKSKYSVCRDSTGECDLTEKCDGKHAEVTEKLTNISIISWIRGRVVKALSIGLKGPEFDPPVRPLLVKIANHCLFLRLL